MLRADFGAVRVTEGFAGPNYAEERRQWEKKREDILIK